MRALTQITLAAVLGLATGTTAMAEDDKALNTDRIVECMRDNLPLSVGIRRISFTTIDRQGESKTVRGRVYAMREKVGDDELLRATLRIEEPPNLADAAYLVRETDDYLRDGMFVYLPAVGRVRRISGDAVADRSLMGTGFSYFDFKQITNAFGDLQPELLAIDEIDGRKTVLLGFTPLEGAQTRYTQVQTWVDQQTCLVLRADFLQDGKVLKRMTAPSNAIVEGQRNRFLKEVRMSDFLSGTTTILKLDEVIVNEPLSSFRFNPATFYQVK